ncbi:MAG: cytochrome c-type biogenesis protein CcmH [Sphingobium sp.]
MIRRLLPALLLIAPAGLPAQTTLPPAPYADTQLEDAALEKKAHDLMLTIRCVTCQSQSIADSNASMASDLRSEIRSRIKAGEDPEAIRKWLIERYGDWISYAPSADPILWPLWAAPLLLLAGGGALVATRLKRRRKDA